MLLALSADRFQKLGLIALVLSLSACARGRGAEATDGSEQRSTELDALQRDFDLSEARLTEQLQRRRSERSSSTAPAPPAPKSSPRADEDERAPAEGDSAPSTPDLVESRETEAAPAEPATTGSIGSACDLMCRALASMRRSANSICSIIGEQHERCSNARTRLEEASNRVKEAGCACL